MLFLTRKKDEKIIISTPHGEIEVLIAAIQGKAVRIGVLAPPEIPVHRGEIYELIKAQAPHSNRHQRRSDDNHR